MDTVMPQQGPRFVSARGLTIALVVMLSLHGAISLVLAATLPGLGDSLLGDRVESFGHVLALLALGTGAVLQWGLFIACAIVFLIWLHRGYENLPALNPDSLYTSKGVVVGWFIPVYNLVHGYRSVFDLYRASQRPVTSESGYVVSRGAPIIGVWWGFYIARGVLNTLSNWITNHDPQHALVWMVGSELCSAIAAALCIVVVLRVEGRQREQYFDLERRAAAALPPPADRLR